MQNFIFVVHTSRAKKNPVKGLAPTVTYWDMAGGLFFIAALYPPILEAVFIWSKGHSVMMPNKNIKVNVLHIQNRGMQLL